jgi:hypothetical protein
VFQAVGFNRFPYQNSVSLPHKLLAHSNILVFVIPTVNDDDDDDDNDDDE